jgi:hypothetical protein
MVSAIQCPRAGKPRKLLRGGGQTLTVFSESFSVKAEARNGRSGIAA